jgi:hypothetical protein
MKIIFLDIDGVLNGYNFWNQLCWRLVCIINNKKLKQWYREVSEPFGIHTPKFKRLVKIVRKTGAKIVLSSSWRWRLTQTPFEEMDKHELKFYNLCKKYNIGIYDITPRSKRGRRDEEIITWLSRFETERLLSGRHDKNYKFVILDDERYDLECFADKELVQTSSVKKGQMIKGHWQETTGLRNKHVRQAIKILNS